MSRRSYGPRSFWLLAAFRLSYRVAMEPAPSPKPCQKPKILAAHRYIFSVNALVREFHAFMRDFRAQSRFVIFDDAVTRVRKRFFFATKRQFQFFSAECREKSFFYLTPLGFFDNHHGLSRCRRNQPTERYARAP